LFRKQPRRPKLSRTKLEIDHELDFDLEDGDMILHIKHNGDIGKVCMPDMNPEVQQSVGYHKMLQVLEILKPGTREEFEKYHDNIRKGTVH
jgi:hypothetical protein